MNLKKIFSFILAAIFLLSTNAYAEKIDHYREILLSKKYTIKYENITPLPRTTNKDRVNLFGKDGLAVNTNEYFTNRALTGILVADGEDHRYQEISYGDFNQCWLLKNDETFAFTKYKKPKSKNNELEYFGSRKGRVEATPRNYLAELVFGTSFGDQSMSRVLNAILPDNEKSIDMPRYEFVTAGKLENGTTFEDFKLVPTESSEEGKNYGAIRFYFKGNSLEKIAYASYTISENGTASGEKFIARITEFSATPDQSLLNLPSQLKDTTKRDKGK